MLIYFSVSLCIVSDIHFPLLAFNGCSLLCWHIFFVNKIFHVFWCCVHFFMSFHRIHSEKFLQSITMQPKLFFISCFTKYIIFNVILKLVFNIRNTCLYLIINFLSKLKINSKHILLFNYFVCMSDFGHGCEFLKN